MPQYPASEKRRIYWLAVLFGIGSVVYYLGYNFWETRNFWDFGKVHSSLTLTSVWEQTPLFIGVLSFIAATLAIYLLVPLVISFCSIQTARLFRVDKSQVMSLTFLVLLALLVWSPLVNGLLYPQSRFGQNFPSLFEGPVGMPLLFLLSAVLGIVLLLGAVVSSVDLLSAIKKSPGQRRFATAAVAVVAVATTGSIFISGVAHESTDVVATAEQPNILIIGIDSLRPDHLGFNGFPDSVTPNLDKYLAESTVFDQALTPLARTYPAWLSILTGLEPINHGARFNLISLDNTEKATRENLSVWLGASGYETVYATDEKRFSNIDQHFGFETLVGPKFGAADFVIGTLHDFPLTNLISNTSLGRMLFPYTYGNRAHIHTYKPDSFNELIDRYLQRRDPDRPLFMSTHFCLAHWPFRWADTESMSREPWPPAAPYEDSKPFYVNSIEATDKQFGRLIDSFSKAGLLENTLVVLLSDHGEGLVMAKDNHLPGYESTEELQVETGGHGTNIDATRQYEVLLALREYGAGQFPVRRIEQMTSLIDIAPTILDYLDLPASEMDGMSLLGLIDEDPATISQFDNRILTLESGYSTQALLSLLPKVEDTLRESAKTYAVNERGRIVIKPQYIDELILKKQRGVISGDWQLSTYRYVREDRYKQRLFNRKSRQYWEDEGLQVADGPLDELTAETCRRFASDEPFAKSDLCRNTALRLAEQQQ